MCESEFLVIAILKQNYQIIKVRNLANFYCLNFFLAVDFHNHKNIEVVNTKPIQIKFRQQS